MKFPVANFCFLFFLATALSYPSSAQHWKAPTTMKKLSNGLIVVVSEDHSGCASATASDFALSLRAAPVLLTCSST
jgi:hypothetical protein